MQLTESMFGLGLTRAFPVQQPVPGYPLEIDARKAQVEFAAATNTSVTVVVIYGIRCHRLSLDPVTWTAPASRVPIDLLRKRTKPLKHFHTGHKPFHYW